MAKQCEIYVCDTETTGLDNIKNDVIELSLYRLSTDEQKTVFIKPFSFEHIQMDALRINGSNLDDLKGLTKEGREKYIDPHKAIADIENWINNDNEISDNRILAGQNIVGFDLGFMISLWNKCNSSDTFPFNQRRSLDTMVIQLFMDVSDENIGEGYNLNSLLKKYGIRNEKAHSAQADCKATAQLLKKQMEYFQSLQLPMLLDNAIND